MCDLLHDLRTIHPSLQHKNRIFKKIEHHDSPVSILRAYISTTDCTKSYFHTHCEIPDSAQLSRVLMPVIIIRAMIAVALVISNYDYLVT